MGDHLGIGKAVEKLMDPVTDLIKRIAGPAADEVGLTLADSVKVYRARRQYRLLEKMNGMIAGAGFVPNRVTLKLLLPALEYASVEDDEDLHTTWAALLANAADPRETAKILPSFPNILRELTPRDARFLAAVASYVSKQIGGPYPHATSIRLRRDNLLKRYVEAGLSRSGQLTNLSVADYTANAENIDADEKDFEVVLETLMRHGLTLEDEASQIAETTRYSEPQLNTTLLYYLSYSGSLFMRACKPPTRNNDV